ncbi:MAG: DUF1566 domain-containing protein [Rhodanobacter sp.]
MNTPATTLNIKRLTIHLHAPEQRHSILGALSPRSLTDIMRDVNATLAENDSVPEGLLYDPETDLYRANNPFGDKDLKWAEAMQACKDLKQIDGFTPFRAATRNELLAMTDITKHNPAVDTAKYPDIKSTWYWSSDVSAESPSDLAWGVYFDYGYASRNGQSYRGRVVAVCSRVSSQ